MPRRLRVEYPEAVTTSLIVEIGRENIFKDDLDHQHQPLQRGAPGNHGAKGRTFGARETPTARLEGNEEKLAASVQKR